NKQRKMLIRIISAAVLIIILHFLPTEGWLRFCLYMIPYLIVGYDILRKAVKGILNGQVFDENFLMAVATVGAIALALISRSGDYTEACAVMLFYQIGELFQGYAVGKSRRNISSLMDIRPDYANLVEDDDVQKVDPDDVEVGSSIQVSPGEKIPIDGIVTEGSSSLNTSALTGESVPRTVRVGDEVISGCINLSGVLRIRTTKEFEESTASKILDLVENSSMRKSRSENFITKFAKYYTPIVCLSALALAVLPPLISGLILKTGFTWGTWVYRALTFLVISCPCALVVSIPLSFFAGIGGASHEGILVKGSNYLETLSKVRTVAFDKTGTMTKGVFKVSGVHHSSLPDRELLRLAALTETYSNHPISKSIKEAYCELSGEDPSDISGSHDVTDVEEISGQGVMATVEGKRLAVGNARLMTAVGAKPIECSEAGTLVHVAMDGKYQGHILISDQLKPTAGEAIETLRRRGVDRTVMLTGDSSKVGQKVALDLGIDQVKCELLPEDKVNEVEKLLTEEAARSGGKSKVAFVGDGINDAPVLSMADVGIAMGALGSDAAIEAADVVLMDDDPLKISKAIGIARKCMRIVYENIVFAIGVKLICLLLGALGIANMWLAIFADVGVMVIAVLNAIRALFVKNL
ncbi:MAG: heavy metal translocating P-type ATPase, partial [Firmicutes bacterium]|nr:heavy metal translocating P-type ATPase [Bacillota bacterium]